MPIKANKYELVLKSHAFAYVSPKAILFCFGSNSFPYLPHTHVNVMLPFYSERFNYIFFFNFCGSLILWRTVVKVINHREKPLNPIWTDKSDNVANKVHVHRYHWFGIFLGEKTYWIPSEWCSLLKVKLIANGGWTTHHTVKSLNFLGNRRLLLVMPSIAQCIHTVYAAVKIMNEYA